MKSSSFEQNVWDNCKKLFSKGWASLIYSQIRQLKQCEFCHIYDEDDFSTHEEWMSHLVNCSIDCGFKDCKSWLSILLYYGKQNNEVSAATVDYLDNVFRYKHEEHLIVLMRIENLKYDTILKFQSEMDCPVWTLPVYFIKFKMNLMTLENFLDYLIQEDYSLTFCEMKEQYKSEVNVDTLRFKVLSHGAVRTYHRVFCTKPQFELDIQVARDILDSMELYNKLHRLQRELVVLTCDIANHCDRYLYLCNPQYMNKVRVMVRYLEVMTKRLNTRDSFQYNNYIEV
jgi:hypothetical protein